ncbi:MAG: Adenylate cyclase 1 [Opitutia bacterium UBA7350]|nr:MAG: Adenylate cyclase 1 [Opitutae bacterium UBA7350]
MNFKKGTLKSVQANLLILVLILVSALAWGFLARSGLLGGLEQGAVERNPEFTLPTLAVTRTMEGSSSLGFGGTLLISLLLTLPVFGLSVYRRRGRIILGLAIGVSLLLYAIIIPNLEAQMNLALPLFVPIGSVLSATAILFLFRLNKEERARRRIQAIFSSYLSPELVDRMLASKQKPQNGGTEVCISILFSDIENFAGIAQELQPDQLVQLMGIYLNAMSEVLHANDATLDKFVGDGIVAMFGMPVVLPNHAAMACRAALQMQERCASLRKSWQASGKWPASVSCLHQRIGIHTGLAVVGNLGSKDRFNYTMIGDSVNLAARCEAIAKQYGVYTMISAETLEAALNDFPKIRYRKIDDVIFKGRYTAIALYELWDESVDVAVALSCKQTYEPALSAYQKGDFAAAIAGFQVALSHEPFRSLTAQSPSAILLTRAQKYLKEGPPSGWKGAYVSLVH